MFGKKTETPSSSGAVRSGNTLSHNSLVQGSKLEGTVTSENDFRIDGIFIGTLTCKARVIIGPSGDFKGDIDCQNAIIEGRFRGTLQARDVLEVREGAVIEGDVNTSKLVVQAGSIFDVKCTMGERQVSPASRMLEEPMLAIVEDGEIDR